jgi:ubiquinone/menaquinone biosynthesis C-methylase UbiE
MEKNMTQYEDVRVYNETLLRANLVDQLVENTDWKPVDQFLTSVGTEDKEVLDIGCATGSIASQAAEAHGNWSRYVGIDLCGEYVVRFNDQGIPNARAVVGSATDLNSQLDSSKDIVMCLFVLQHLSRDDGKKVLKEIWEVAKPNADVLIGLTVNPVDIESERMYTPNTALAAGAKEVLTFIWNQAEFIDALIQEGFEIIREETIPGRAPYVKLYIWRQLLTTHHPNLTSTLCTADPELTRVVVHKVNGNELSNNLHCSIRSGAHLCINV